MNDQQHALLGELDELVRKRTRQRTALKQTDEQVHAAIVAGCLLDVPKLTLSQRGKVSRQTVYDLLNAHEGGEGNG